MKATEKLHELGQSLWLDNITREMLDSGTLQQYSDDYSVTGRTSNPAIFKKAIADAGARPFCSTWRSRTVAASASPNFRRPDAADGHAGAGQTAATSRRRWQSSRDAGVDVDALAAKLQSDAATGFVDAWNDLMAHIDEQSAALRV